MKKQKIWIVIAVTLVIIAGIVAVFIGKNFIKNQDEEALRMEMERLLSLDITKDRYNQEAKSEKEYKKVEQLMKEYLDNYATEVQSALRLIQEDRLQNILAVENLKADGKKFVETTAYLKNYRRDLNNHIDKIISMSQEDIILSKLKADNLKPYYQDLYRDIMINTFQKNLFKPQQEDFRESKELVNQMIDIFEETIQFLIDQQDHWELENQQIIFDDENLTNQYYAIVEQLNQ